MEKLNIKWNKNKNERLIEEKSHVYHCHHYNCHLQMCIEGPKFIDGKGIQINAAREVGYEHFLQILKNHPNLDSPKKKLDFASNLFQLLGYGLIKFDGVSDKGGIVKCPTSHYAKGWLSKQGKRKTPVCLFNTGWIAGVMAAVYQKQLYYYDVTETQCESVQGKGCTFKVEVR